MSRSGYFEIEFVSPEENWSLIRWRGAVKSAIRGKRGQMFLKELLVAMDSMNEKELIANSLEAEGKFCALGVIGHARGIDMKKIHPEDYEEVSSTFDIAEAMCREIVFMNDEYCYHEETPKQRFDRMRAWIEDQIKTPLDISE